MPALITGLSPEMILNDGDPRVEYDQPKSNLLLSFITLAPFLIGLLLTPATINLHTGFTVLDRSITFLLFAWLGACYKDLGQFFLILIGQHPANQ